MRGAISEPQRRAGGVAALTSSGRGSLGGPDDHLLAFSEFAPENFGEVRVGESKLNGEGSRLAVGTRDPDATRTVLTTGVGLINHRRLKTRPLLFREDLRDLFSGGLPDVLLAAPAFSLRQTVALEGQKLLLAVSENRIQFSLLLLSEAETPDEPVANRVKRLACGVRWLGGSSRSGVQWGGVRLYPRRVEAQGGVWYLQDRRLLVHDKPHVGRHPGS